MISTVPRRRLLALASAACLLFSTLAARPNQKRRTQRNNIKRVAVRKHNTVKQPPRQAPVMPSAPLFPAVEDASVPIDKRYNVQQGKTLHLKIASPSRLKQAYAVFAGSQYTFSAVPNRDNRYECFVPVDCDHQPGEYKVVVRTDNEQHEQKSIGCAVTVEAFPFKHQRGFKISKKKLQAIRAASGVGGSRYGQVIREYQKNSPSKKLWEGPFITPINVQRITSPFGEVRTSHGFGKRKHYGIDLAEHHRAPIHAANHGIVTQKTHTATGGNMVVIDHGLGVSTFYLHMNSFAKNLKIGDKVTKGQRLGEVGQTGYASGPHLHLELRIKDANNQKATAVDFMEWTKNIY